jgi:hypothetical protein
MLTLKLEDKTELELPDNDKKAARFLANIINNSGYAPGQEERVDYQDFAEKLLMKDAVGISNIRPLLSSTIETILREPVDPMMVITHLYSRIQAKGLDKKILAGALGPVTAADVNERGTYPEVMFQVGGGIQVAQIGKSGVAAAFTDEALRYSTWDIMALNLRQMSAALVRHKEQKAVAFLSELGTELFNNRTPATSAFGVTTGRALDGTANASLISDDLFRGMALMAEEGFPADVFLMNPQFFYLFIQDPIMRGMMMAHGGGAYFNQFTGEPGPKDPWSQGSLGGMAPSLGNRVVPGGSPSGEAASGISGREHGMTAAPPMPPSYFPWNFRIMVSPLVPFDSNTQSGDIYLLSSGNVGFYLEDETPTQVEWRDEDTEVVKVKIRERYGFAVSNEGQGVGVFKNVKLSRNYWDGVANFTGPSISSEIAADADLTSLF